MENANPAAAYLRHAPRDLLTALKDYAAATRADEPARMALLVRLSVYATAKG